MSPGASPVVIHDCGVAVRPCPHAECRHFLAPPEAVHRRGRPRSLPTVLDASDSCALDVADRVDARISASKRKRKPVCLESYAKIARRLGLSRQRVEQIAHEAWRKVVAALEEGLDA